MREFGKKNYLSRIFVDVIAIGNHSDEQDHLHRAQSPEEQLLEPIEGYVPVTDGTNARRHFDNLKKLK